MRVVAPFVRLGGQALIVAIAALAAPDARAGTETVESTRLFTEGQNSGSITIPAFDTLGGTRGLTGVTITVTFDAAVTGLTADNDDPMMAPEVQPIGRRAFTILGPGGYQAAADLSTDALSVILPLDPFCECTDCDGNNGVDFSNTQSVTNSTADLIAEPKSLGDYQQGAALGLVAFDVEFSSFFNAIEEVGGSSCSLQLGDPSPTTTVRIRVDYAFEPINSACDCYWINGEPDDVEAAPSETNVPTPPSEAADDFIVPAGKVLLADHFCGCLATNDLPRWDGNTYDEPDAILNIYDDCNGKPGQLIATYTDPEWEILGDAPFGSPGQWKYIRFCWDNLQLVLPARDAERRLWVSLVGVGDMDPGERYRWATSATAPDRPIQGVQAQLRSSWIVGFEDWQNLDESNAGCHDLCFELCGDLCHVVCDNGPYALDCGLKMLNTTTFGNRTADNFAIPPCTSADLCVAEVYIATNCEPSRARFDIYTNTCDTPDQLVTSRGNPEVIPQLNDGGQPVTFPSPVSGRLLTVYCLRWRFEPGSLVLDGERNYWISAYLEGTGVLTEEAFVLCKQVSDCHIKITQARFLSSSFGQTTWEPVETILPAARDLAFSLLGTLQRTNPPSAAAPPQPAAPRCAGDTNNDNRVDAADLSVLLHVFNQAGVINSAADFNADGVVDAADLSILLGRFGMGC